MSTSQEVKAIIEVRNPVANLDKGDRIPPAARLQSLKGKKIALWWNGKARGDVALQRVGELLESRFGAKCMMLGTPYPHGDEAYEPLVKAGADAVILTTGD
jgi:hypothetical protein